MPYEITYNVLINYHHRSCDAGTERLISRVKKARKFAKVRETIGHG